MNKSFTYLILAVMIFWFSCNITDSNQVEPSELKRVDYILTGDLEHHVSSETSEYYWTELRSERRQDSGGWTNNTYFYTRLNFPQADTANESILLRFNLSEVVLSENKFEVSDSSQENIVSGEISYDYFKSDPQSGRTTSRIIKDFSSTSGEFSIVKLESNYMEVDFDVNFILASGELIEIPEEGDEIRTPIENNNAMVHANGKARIIFQ